MPSRAARARGCIPGARAVRPRPPAPAARCHSPFAKAQECDAQVVLRHGPVERHPLAGVFLERERKASTPCSSPAVPLPRSPSISRARPRLFWVPAQSSGTRSREFLKGARKVRRPAPAVPCPLPFAEPRERVAQVHLGHGPVQRHALAGLFLQRGAVGGDRLLKPRGAALAFAEARKRVRRGSSGSWPIRAARVRGCIPAARAGRRRPPARAAPCRSRARRASRARCPGCSGSWPSRAARVRG